MQYCHYQWRISQQRWLNSSLNLIINCHFCSTVLYFVSVNWNLQIQWIPLRSSRPPIPSWQWPPSGVPAKDPGTLARLRFTHVHVVGVFRQTGRRLIRSVWWARNCGRWITYHTWSSPTQMLSVRARACTHTSRDWTSTRFNTHLPDPDRRQTCRRTQVLTRACSQVRIHLLV